MKYKAPLEIQVLNLQEIAYRNGWESGKRENLAWAMETLRYNDYHDAADFLESLVLDETTRRIKQATRFQPSKHTQGNQAQKVKAPNTAVQWPGQKP